MRQLEVELNVSAQQIDKLVPVGVHFPVVPVLGANELADQPTLVKACHVGSGKWPKLSAAWCFGCITALCEMHVGLLRIQGHGVFRECRLWVLTMKFSGVL
jgi:hypothetical protein